MPGDQAAKPNYEIPVSLLGHRAWDTSTISKPIGHRIVEALSMSLLLISLGTLATAPRGMGLSFLHMYDGSAHLDSIHPSPFTAE